MDYITIPANQLRVGDLLINNRGNAHVVTGFSLNCCGPGSTCIAVDLDDNDGASMTGTALVRVIRAN